MNRNKLLLWILGVPFLLIQSYWTFAPGGGIVDRYGFFNAFPKYFALNWGDPLLMAGITDFMTVITIGLVWMIFETPPERRWTPKFCLADELRRFSRLGLSAVFPVSEFRSPFRQRTQLAGAVISH